MDIVIVDVLMGHLTKHAPQIRPTRPISSILHYSFILNVPKASD